MKTNGKPMLSLREHNMKVIEEARSHLNLWGTGEELHHSPDTGHREDRNELVTHYIRAGGIVHLEQEHRIVEDSWVRVQLRIAMSWWRKNALPFLGTPLR